MLEINSTKIPKEIKDKYKLVNNSLRKITKSDWKDRITTEIGDVKQADFFPQIKIGRWGDSENDNECNFSVRLLDGETGNAKIETEGDKIKWAKGNKTARFYEIAPSEQYPEGAFEFDIELKKKPKTNKIEFSLNTKGVDFFYQPALTQQEIDKGAIRPENVVGSYAVYASEQKTNWKGGKEYKVGKVGHIYRPKIYDATGADCWGILSVGKEAGKLIVEIPQEFLDNAVYPVVVDPTFGYTSGGGSQGEGSYSEARIGNFYTSPGAGTLNSVSLYTATLTKNKNINSGSGSWTIPEDVTSVTVYVQGGGGAGGGRTSSGQAGGGGGGAASIKIFSGLTPGNTISYSVGAAKAGTTGNGGTGNTTWFSSNDSSGCVAVGGGGGLSAGGAGSGGAAASGYGDTKYSGGNGSAAASGYSGAGGGGASTTGNGNNASGATPGAHIDAAGGAGGRGVTGNYYAGVAGTNYGGGGGGESRTSGSGNGGTGAGGYIIIKYIQPVRVKALVNQKDSVASGQHSQIAISSEVTIDSLTPDWKVLNLGSEAISNGVNYIPNIIRKYVSEADSGYMFTYYDLIEWTGSNESLYVETFSEATNYASPTNPWTIDLFEPTYGIPEWQISTYYSGYWNNVYNMAGDGKYHSYYCIVEHTSSADDEPGVGANWET
jgi:hypothetical protein